MNDTLHERTFVNVFIIGFIVSCVFCPLLVLLAICDVLIHLLTVYRSISHHFLSIVLTPIVDIYASCITT